ncbi:uncharacterized protein LOC131605205 [Vicia villosa]|uniref:uncharacterized protein LOC131605205 n=1 Tax=Vicia villosa TaxID=3911 RepID=UPI00273AE134|nr:uncharacterized protein LOC131605205 [Vicia villosa]
MRAGEEEAQLNFKGLSDIEDDNTEDGLEEYYSEDEYVGKALWQTFKMPKSIKDYKWQLGTYFFTNQDFKDAIRTYEIHNGRNMKFKKNDKKKDESDIEQYKRIHDYAHELLRANSGSTIKVTSQPFQGEVENIENPQSQLNPHFQIMYICFKACKNNFFKCRPIIGLDGCFLKGYYGGHILAAIGRDPNDQIIPIAFAAVEGETKDSWSWFLELLISDLGWPRICKTYTFISDQQKRFCVRHLYNNFRKIFPGAKLKELMWKAATTSYTNAFEKAMLEMKGVNETAFKHLIKLAKRIITMLEEIRVYLMLKWESNREKIAKFEGDTLPNIKKKLAKESGRTKYWIVRRACEFVYEVRYISNNEEKYVVNLSTKTCSCRLWMLTGLSCCHAMTCMKSQLDVEKFMPDYYKKAVYEACYAIVIFPVNGENMGEKKDYDELQPPPIKRQPGRPKRRELETHLRVSGTRLS